MRLKNTHYVDDEDNDQCNTETNSINVVKQILW